MFRSKRRIVEIMVCLAIVLVLALNTYSTTRAASYSQQITVIRQLVVWARPTYRSPVVSVLMRGRHFMVDGRNLSGSWIHGVTDMGIAGWVPSFGFLQLHMEVNPALLPVLSISTYTPVPMMGMGSGMGMGMNMGMGMPYRRY